MEFWTEGFKWFFIDLLGKGLVKAWVWLPRTLKYCLLFFAAVIALSFGSIRFSIFLVAFIPAMYFANPRENAIPYAVLALPFFWSVLFMTTNSWRFGLGMLIASITIALFDHLKTKSSWPFAIMFFLFCPIAYFGGDHFWTITYAVVGCLILICSSLWRNLATTDKP